MSGNESNGNEDEVPYENEFVKEGTCHPNTCTTTGKVPVHGECTPSAGNTDRRQHDHDFENELMKMAEQLIQLQEEKKQMECDFCVKRAQLKELFLKKEDELKQERAKVEGIMKEMSELKQTLQDTESELNETKNQIIIMECTKENELEFLKQKQDDLDSLHEYLEKEHQNTVSHLQGELEILKCRNEQLQEVIDGSKCQASDTSITNTVLSFSAVTRNLAKRVGGLTAPSVNVGALPVAKEDAEMLRSLVVPLEEEVTALKDKLRDAYEKIRVYESTHTAAIKSSEAMSDLLKGKPLPEVIHDLDEKLKEVSNVLEVEKSSRADLEMYVAILSTQKAVLQEDSDRLRSQLHEVCKALEEEKKSHGELKQTWQMANDQFLESQRVHMKEISLIQKFLTPEQLFQISEMKKQEDQGQSCKLQNQNSKLSAAQKKSKLALVNQSLLGKLSPVRRQKGTDVQSEVSNAFSKSYSSESLQESSVHRSPERLPGLTEDQHRALVDLTPELEARKNLISCAKSLGHAEMLCKNGKRLVSEEEWMALQAEIRNTYQRLSYACESCQLHEIQLHKQQEEIVELTKANAFLEKALEKYKEEMMREHQQQKEIEEKWMQSIKNFESMLCKAQQQEEQCQECFSEIRQANSHVEEVLSIQLMKLESCVQHLEQQLIGVQKEKDDAYAKYTEHSHMLKDRMPMPENIQVLIVDLQDELVRCHASREKTEGKLRNENCFLRDELKVEQYQKECLEVAYSAELENLKVELKKLQTLPKQMDPAHCDFCNNPICCGFEKQIQTDWSLPTNSVFRSDSIGTSDTISEIVSSMMDKVAATTQYLNEENSK